MKRKGTNDPEVQMFAGPAPVPASALTPLDIQNKEFRVARMGGYRMREVDEFLDEVTEAMSSLIAENDRLRGGGDAGGAAVTDDRELAAARSEADRIVAEARRDASRIRADAGAEGAVVASPDDASAVQAFLRKEKDFLRSLGSLVQGHAEEMKGMARASRPGPTSVPPASAPTTALPDAEAEEGSEGTADPAATAAMSRDELGVEASEPITISEPEPAGSRKTEERRSEGSLRDLFWGEDG